jgi:galactokinase
MWGTDFDDLELARIGQEDEHKFAGARCGLLDQVTSLFATRDRVNVTEDHVLRFYQSLSAAEAAEARPA